MPDYNEGNLSEDASGSKCQKVTYIEHIRLYQKMKRRT
jgi:hypothetical protein